MARFTYTAPPERVGRGMLLAMIVVPVGLVAYLLVWHTGLNPGAAALLIALGALTLYRRGSGGRVGHEGMVWIISIAAGTSLIALQVGLLWDATVDAGQPITDLVTLDFWSGLASRILFGDLWLLLTVALTILFTVVGCLGVFASVRTSRILQAHRDARAAN